MSKTVTSSVSLPADLARELARIARLEHRTKSGLIQEALRHYLEARQWRALQRDIQARARQLGLESEDDVERLLDDVRE
jgi:predicted transcriptional regulator